MYPYINLYTNLNTNLIIHFSQKNAPIFFLGLLNESLLRKASKTNNTLKHFSVSNREIAGGRVPTLKKYKLQNLKKEKDNTEEIEAYLKLLKELNDEVNTSPQTNPKKPINN